MKSTVRRRYKTVLLAASVKSKDLTPIETTCLKLYISLTMERGGLFISTFRSKLPHGFTIEVADTGIHGLIDKGILVHEKLPEDMSNVGGGSALSLSGAILDRL